MSAVRMVKLKKMGEILYKSYIMVIARSFWKIDKVMELEMSINSSFLMNAKRLNCAWSQNGDDDDMDDYAGQTTLRVPGNASSRGMPRSPSTDRRGRTKEKDEILLLSPISIRGSIMDNRNNNNKGRSTPRKGKPRVRYAD